MNETFWGVPCLSGDDKRLTTLILERGYLTYMQRSAEVWSTFPTTWQVFFKQRLRWARNTWRSDLRALGSRWVYRHPFLAFTMMDKAISSFTLLVGPAFLAYSIAVRNWAFVHRAGGLVADQPLGQAAAAPAPAPQLVLLRPGLRHGVLGDGVDQALRPVHASASSAG